MLKELFTAPLLELGNNASQGPPVINVDVDASGKFAFVELQNESLAATALQLFNEMDLCGRQMRVGRPQGYVDTSGGVNVVGAPGMMPGMGGAAAFSMNPALMAGMGAGPASAFMCLENLISEAMLKDDAEYTEVVDDIRSECSNSGAVLEMVVPREGAGSGKVFVQFADVAASAKAFNSLNGRQFDGNVVKALYITQADFTASA
jgi:splicing factor U2AF subunit